MKQPNLLKLSLLLVMAMVLMACPKQEPVPEIKHYLPQEFKDYTVFKEGTWWAYEDSATGKVDTIKVLESGDGFVKSYNYDENRIKLEVYGSYWYTNDTLFGSFQFKPEDGYNLSNKYVLYYRNNSIGGGGVQFPILSFSEDTQWIGFPYVSKNFINKFDEYSQVFVSTSLNNLPGSNLYLYEKYNQFLTIWFAPKIGPIKYKLRNGQVLNLKNHHVIQ